MTTTNDITTKPLERPYQDSIALLTRFIDQEQELRGENDKNYDYTAEQAHDALQVIQDTMRGITVMTQITALEIASKERRIRELILAGSRDRDISDQRRNRLVEIANIAESLDLGTAQQIGEACRRIHKLATDPIRLISGQVA